MIHDIRLPHPLEFLFALKPLLLYASDIKDICIGQDFVNRVALINRDPRFSRSSHNTVRHSQRRGGDKIEANRVERQESHKAVNSTTVQQITKESDRAPIHSPEFRSYSEDVEQGLEGIITV